MNNDLISRSALIEDFKSRLPECNDWIENAKDNETKIRASAVKTFIAEVILTINNAPTVEYPCVIKVKTGVDAQRVSDELRRLSKMGVIFPVEDIEVKRLERSQGEWIFVSRHCYKCPFCNELSKGKNYCPNCGADMRGDKND